MPELPEVETMVRGIRTAIVGAKIETVQLPPCTYRPILMEPKFSAIQKRTCNQSITEVQRYAKRVVIHLDNTDRFVIEPRMTGLMLLSDPPSEEHLRFCWNLTAGNKQFPLWFWDRRGLGTLRLYRPEEFEQAFGAGKIGPDALQMTTKLWRQQLQRTSRAVKPALLDQKLVAGIGNLYASEILHLARISPLKEANTLNRQQIMRLAEATDTILNTAIQYEGSTLSDGTYRNALNQNGGYQNEHRVYGKAGQTCPVCQRGTIKRIVQAQRSTFYCPNCQKNRLK